MEEPPVITPPAGKRRNKNWLYMLVALGAPFIALVLFFYPALARPPKESHLLQSFQKNRAAFEQLRDMLTADTNVERVADWGIGTWKPHFRGSPTAVGFPMARYEQYRALLRKLGGNVALRSEGEPADISVCVWEGGTFAAHTRIEVSWMGKVPTNQVTNLDHCRRQYPSEDRQYIYRHIDENWYLSTDLRPF